MKQSRASTSAPLEKIAGGSKEPVGAPSAAAGAASSKPVPQGPDRQATDPAPPRSQNSLLLDKIARLIAEFLEHLPAHTSPETVTLRQLKAHVQPYFSNWVRQSCRVFARMCLALRPSLPTANATHLNHSVSVHTACLHSRPACTALPGRTPSAHGVERARLLVAILCALPWCALMSPCLSATCATACTGEHLGNTQGVLQGRSSPAAGAQP